MSQQMSFVGPVRPGDTVDAVVTVKELIRDKSRAVLETVCSVEGAIVVSGEALVKTTSAAKRIAIAS
jgi:3-hydroxybutyryl-CoA dehydratase